jgi:hypothetical protein
MMYPHLDYSLIKERHDELLKEAQWLQLEHQADSEHIGQLLSGLYALLQKLRAYPAAKLKPLRR